MESAPAPRTDRGAPLRIGIVGPVYPLRGGISHHTALVARALGARHDVGVHSFARLYPSWIGGDGARSDPSARPLEVAARRRLSPLEPWTWRAAAREIVAQGPDSVLFQFWHPFVAPAYAAVARVLRSRLPAVRILWICHNALPHERVPFAERILPFAYAGVDGLLCHSEVERRRLQGLGVRRPIVVAPHPTYGAFVEGAPGREEARRALGLSGPVLLFFGHVRPYKGLATFLESLPGVLARRPDATALVVGDFFVARAPYERLVRRLGIADRVRIVDRYVPNEELGTWFGACDVVVLPYDDATQSGVVELAFAFGRPVVATRVGGLAEAVEDGVTGLLVPPRDPPALAAAVERLLGGAGAQMARAVAARGRRPVVLDLADAVERLDALARLRWDERAV